MSNSVLPPPKSWNRRQVMKWGLSGIGMAGGAIALSHWSSPQTQPAKIPPLPTVEGSTALALNPMQVLRDFDYGTIKRENGKTIREFRIEVKNTTIQLNSAVSFNAWTFNQRIPGPTLRAKEGDRIRVVFLNQGGHAHSLHFHGTHRPEMDGIKPIRNGNVAIYEFDAKPYGLHLYHCHVEPVTRHIGKGLYGLFIIDPPTPRSPADEMVMVMAGYDTNEDGRNELYGFNGIPDYYMHHPIPIYQNQRIRLYLLNMMEFEAAATFHIHANFFEVYRTGMTLTPQETNDVITMGVAERHILEFSYQYPGKYMFHPHQDAIAEHGCMGYFDVLPT